MILDVGSRVLVRFFCADKSVYRYAVVTEIEDHMVVVTLVCVRVINGHVYPLWTKLQSLWLPFTRSDSMVIHGSIVAKMWLI
jgi:hypothetical protein